MKELLNNWSIFVYVLAIFILIAIMIVRKLKFIAINKERRRLAKEVWGIKCYQRIPNHVNEWLDRNVKK